MNAADDIKLTFHNTNQAYNAHSHSAHFHKVANIYVLLYTYLTLELNSMTLWLLLLLLPSKKECECNNFLDQVTESKRVRKTGKAWRFIYDT